MEWNGIRIQARRSSLLEASVDPLALFPEENLIYMGKLNIDPNAETIPPLTDSSVSDLSDLQIDMLTALSAADSATRFVPGRGDVFDSDTLLAYADALDLMLLDIRDRGDFQLRSTIAPKQTDPYVVCRSGVTNSREMFESKVRTPCEQK